MRENVIESMRTEDVYNDNIENIKIMDNPRGDNIKNLLILLTILLIILTISIFITKFILNDSDKISMPDINNDLTERINLEQNINVSKIKENDFNKINSILEIREKKNKKIVTTVINNRTKSTSNNISSNQFYIKISSLAEEPSSSYLSKISKLGFSYKLVRLQKSNKPLVRVLIGPFLSKKSADNNLAFIQKRFSKSAYITKMK